MIAQIDDTAHVRKDSIKPCPQFPDFALITCLCWSKNVHDERDAPEQILLGAMDPVYCVLLGHAIYFEVYIATGEGRLGEYVFCEAGCSPNSVKANAQSLEVGYFGQPSIPESNPRRKSWFSLKSKSLGVHTLTLLAAAQKMMWTIVVREKARGTSECCRCDTSMA